MSSPFFERASQEARVGELHSRIRNLEALVASGSDPSVCPDCVLDPFTVNPGDISVPEIYRDCVDIAGAVGTNPVDTCGTGDVFIVNSIPIGYCSAFGLGKPMGLQVRAQVAFGPCSTTIYGPTANIANVKIWAGAPIEAGVAAVGWDVAGTPGQSPCLYDTGWLEAEGVICGPSCNPITASLSFNPYSSFTGACGAGSLGARWVVLNDDEEYRGALDDIPQAEDGDVVHFNSETHEWTTGPARRRTSVFMG